MAYKSIEERLIKLRRLQQRETGIVKSKGTKKTRRYLLLEKYCKDQKGYCMVCSERMVKPVFKQDDRNIIIGACCGKEACREAVETNEWFKG